MAASTQRRGMFEPGNGPVRSPSPIWDPVYEAAGTYLTHTAQVARIGEGIAELMREITDARILLEQSEEVVERADREETRRLTAEKLGQPYRSQTPALAVATAERDRARADLDRKHKLIDALRAEQTRAQEAQADSQRALRAAARKAHGIYLFPAMMSVYDAGRAQEAVIGEAMQAIGPSRIPEDLYHWDAQNRPLPPVPPIAQMLRAAIDKVERGQVDEGRAELDAAMELLPTSAG